MAHRRPRALPTLAVVVAALLAGTAGASRSAAAGSPAASSPAASSAVAGVAASAPSIGGLRAGTGSSRRDGILPPANPPENIPAAPRLAGASCSATSSGGKTTYRCDNPCADAEAVMDGVPPALNGSAACTAAALRAIDRARAAEGVGPMVLPRDWSRLSVAEQLFVVADLERVARGVPPLVGLVPVLDAAAEAGALTLSDPEYPLGAAQPGPESSNWAGDEYSVLVADYEWMYADGWGRSGADNIDCRSPHAPGCWAHRDNILGAVTGVGCRDRVMGAGYAAGVHGFGTSYAELFLRPVRSPAMRPIFTWAADVVPQLPQPPQPPH